MLLKAFLLGVILSVTTSAYIILNIALKPEQKTCCGRDNFVAKETSPSCNSKTQTLYYHSRQHNNVSQTSRQDQQNGLRLYIYIGNLRIKSKIWENI